MMTLVNSPRTSGTTGQPATPWSALDAELRMLCRSLTHGHGWTAQSITTFVTLPGDAEYEQALTTLCRRLADEYHLEQTVWCGDDQWVVRFARPTSVTALRRGDYEYFGAATDSHLPGYLARLREAARQVYGARFRR